MKGEDLQWLEAGPLICQGAAEEIRQTQNTMMNLDRWLDHAAALGTHGTLIRKEVKKWIRKFGTGFE